jgi:hypothetical protein
MIQASGFPARGRGGSRGGRLHVFWIRVQACDPRILYALFALLMVSLQFVTPRMPAPVPRAVRSLYERIDNLPPGRIVLVDCSMDSGWVAEGEPALEVIVRHLFRRRQPFALFTNTTYYQGQRFASEIAGRVAREMGRAYGTDYCIWQAVVLQGGATVQALAKDIPGTVGRDINGTPLNEVPMMRQVRDIRDVALVYRVAYDWEGIPWIGFVQSVYGTPFAVGVASISSSTAYPFVDSGQMCGLVSGAAGAAAYERLLQHTGRGTRTAAVQSFATLYVVLAIVIGNVAMFAARLTRPREAAQP